MRFLKTTLLILVSNTCVVWRAQADEPAFYIAENPNYTIVNSSLDSLRFTLDKTLRLNDAGHLESISSFVDPEARVMQWHDFGNLEGPGWAANAVGGAYEIYLFGQLLDRPQWRDKALGILDHVLEDGFIDRDTGFITPYRLTTSGEFCLNYVHNSDWFCPGSMAKVAYQLLIFSDALGDDPRAATMRQIAVKCGEWLHRNVQPVPNHWYPRRTTPDGQVYRKSPTGGNDPFWQTSADGIFIVQLHTALTKRGLSDYRTTVREKVDTLIGLNGIFGSINHDTYDPDENVAYSVSFRTLLEASRLLGDESVRDFAYRRCLSGLNQFKMCEDRNGVATKGLLYMEKTWDTSYLWENAEAALAYFEAAVDTRAGESERSRLFELDGLTLLRAAAKHHYGPHGFLTEGVDWNDHVGQQHHIEKAKYGAIQYTEPFLNNQHITEPTWYYLTYLATQTNPDGRIEWRDTEGNVLWQR